MATVALSSLVLLTGLQTLLYTDYREAAYLESYGSLVASQMARLGQDAMVREDAIALNVLAEQVAAEPAILQIEIYAMDGATLASYADPGVARTDNSPNRTLVFTRPIQLADATAGFVKVVVNNAALRQSHSRYQWQDRLRLGTAAALSALALALLIFWLTRTHPDDEPADPARSIRSASQGEPTETSFYMVLANLFNGSDMQTARRNALMAAARTNTDSVAQLYQGRVQQISPTALAILFDQVDTPGRSFQVACAALVLSRLGNQPGGARFRYSLQHLDLEYGPDSLLAPAADEAREDALLHAALAEDNAVVLAADFARQLPRPERFELTSEHSPSLAALHTNQSRDYFLMSSAKPVTEAMLSKQIDALRQPST